MELPTEKPPLGLIAPAASYSRWDYYAPAAPNSVWPVSASPQASSASSHDIVPATLLRIFVGEQDRHRFHSLYEEIVLKARDMHLAGATVLRGPLGFGRSHRLHTQKILRLSGDLPMVVEIVDTAEKIEGFLPILDEIMTGGIATLEQISIVRPIKPQNTVAA